MTTINLRNAMDAWKSTLGVERVLDATAAEEKWGTSTSGRSPGRIAGAVQPGTVDEVRAVMAIAQANAVPVYPISTGRNWGYGTATPVARESVILDLSAMNRIRDFDEELGTVTVEPGVTQGQLRDYLDKRGLEFLVPVHGGGPRCSLMGNALERGMGITPHTDHFAAVTAMEVVLPTGDIYRPALTELGAAGADKLFKWGVGPFLNGIFSQGNFGVVTAITIVLARKPVHIEAFYFWIEKDEQLEESVVAVRELLRSLGPIVGAINIMDQRRMISLSTPYPFDRVPSGSAMPQELAEELGRKTSMPAWFGVGALYGDRAVVRAAKKIVKRSLKKISSRVIFATPTLTARFLKIFSWAPFLRETRFMRVLEILNEGMKVLRGIPSEIALKTPYWKIRRPIARAGSPDPARDGCGILWYAPLVPMKPGMVRSYVDMLRRVMIRHGLDPLITLITMSERCFDSPIPLLFDATDPSEVQRAKVCFQDLFDEGRKNGFVPYRIGVDHMTLLTKSGSPFWRLASEIKKAVDPAGILSPGRYNLTDEPERATENGAARDATKNIPVF